MKPYSLRSSTQYPAGSELLETRFAGKQIPILISMRPDRLLEGDLLPDGDAVRITHMRNSFRVIKDMTTMLADARPGETLLILCESDKIYRAALTFLCIEPAAAR